MTEFRLPELGEGIEDGVIVEIKVQPGDSISPQQEVFVIETDKASMPIEYPHAGVVESIAVKAGQRVKVGQILANFAGANGKVPEKQAPKTNSESPKSEAPPKNSDAESATVAELNTFDFVLPDLGEGIDSGVVVGIAAKVGESVEKDQELFTIETDKAAMPIPAPVAGVVEAILVKEGDRPKIGATLAKMKVSSQSSPTAPKPASAPTKKVAPAPAEKSVTETSSTPSTGVVNATGPVPASPSTRKYAREHQVDLNQVAGTARGGRVTSEDVRTFIRAKMNQPAATSSAVGSALFSAPPMPDFSKYGPIVKKPVSNIRKKIAENLSLSWHMAPAVNQFDLADITDLEAGRKRIVDAMPKGTAKITMTVLAIKAVVAALKEFPHFNASLDMQNGEVIYKEYYHIGIAVDTERGLVVPVIRDADKKTIRDLAQSVAALADKARSGKLTPDEMRGGTFTITNLGGIGGTAFSPIINYPEVAILGLSRSSIQPAYRDNQFVARLMMPLCLTYDHRIIDGADGARFTTRLVQLFSDPIRLLMES
ncbi:MAG: 2-oxo acid dehydrogenase subunit E2 [Zavarzinella sp.]